jgi:hypothetical protein
MPRSPPPRRNFVTPVAGLLILTDLPATQPLGSRPVPDGVALPPTYIRAEHRGLARVFRNEVKAVDEAMDKALAIVRAPLVKRLSRHTRLRAEMLPDLARAYAARTPERFRIGSITGTKHKTEFAIVEHRLCVSWMKNDAWAGDASEPGVTICRVITSVKAGTLRERWTPYVTISLHALSRRIERGLDRSHDAVFRDIALLAAVEDEPSRVATPDGFWLGRHHDAFDEQLRVIRVHDVRTWI